MKLDLDFILKGFDGTDMKSEDLSSIHAGQVLASQLYSAREAKNPIKYFDWALKLYNKQAIELDEADLKDLKSFLEGHKGLYVIAKAQLLKCLNALEEEKN